MWWLVKRMAERCFQVTEMERLRRARRYHYQSQRPAAKAQTGELGEASLLPT